MKLDMISAPGTPRSRTTLGLAGLASLTSASKSPSYPTDPLYQHSAQIGNKEAESGRQISLSMMAKLKPLLVGDN